ncbi:uncharacterized protein SCHCODRAFT_02523071 [Schizophyllum commune H4-8]|nr:uncharacterized protein SCHCODRAFT_02523071 [Schizophyllum commune H4-8]KAI5900787.1 hypothetical protein SCHCODRAFT_02523071 [Schizophyllum commune H4-8]
MNGSQLVALAILAAYFGIILLVFGAIVAQIRSFKASWNRRASAFVTLTALSFGYTWYYMIKFMKWSYNDYATRTGVLYSDISPLQRVADWLVETSLFEQAWMAVSFGYPLRWWISEQLCIFTAGAWTILMATEGPRRQLRYVWLYMLLGQIVAISVACNLFFALLSVTEPKRGARLYARPTLWLSVLASLVTVAISPYTDETTFLPNLLVMHVLLIIPLATHSVTSVKDADRSCLSIDNLYTLVMLSGFLLRVRTTLDTVYTMLAEVPAFSVLDFAHAAWVTLHWHPAQASIGWDVIWTTISFVFWIALRPGADSDEPKARDLAYLALATPIASAGVTAPHVLRRRHEDEGREKSD